MKILKTITIFAFAVSCAATLNAQTKMYITGSTAYRSAVHTAILHIYDSGVVYGYTGTSFGGASQAIFSGTVGGVSTQISTSWSGSEAGIQAVADPNPATTVNFLPDATCPGSCSTTGTASLGTGTEAHKPLVAMSDTFQSTSAFNSTFNGVTYNALLEADGTSAGHGSPVGVVPFKWCASASASPPFTNITSQLARSLYQSSFGKLPLALFTGSSADETKPVIAMGRNPDSGTRLTAFAESGVGALSSVKQLQPQDSTGALVKATSSTISKFVQWPIETINGVSTGTTGNSGFSSGGDLSKAMRAVTTDPVTVVSGGTHSYAAASLTRVAYLGTGDADANLLSCPSPPCSPALGVELSYNGVLLGNVGGTYGTVTVLTEGEYTFWGFEHLLYNSGIDAAVKTAADKLATQLHDSDAVVTLGAMKVTRATDGANVTANYATP